MKFENKTGERIKYCLGDREKYDFVTIRPGEKKELKDEARALANGLTEYEEPKEEEEVKAVESTIGKKVVETKVIKKKSSRRRK